MNIINKITSFIKNIFYKQNDIKNLEAPKKVIYTENFVTSLKISPTKNINNRKIETLTCNGDGLGIQKKISS